MNELIEAFKILICKQSEWKTPDGGILEFEIRASKL